MSLTYNRATNESPDGIEWKAMDLLLSNCQITDDLASAELMTKLNELSMKRDDSP